MNRQTKLSMFAGSGLCMWMFDKMTVRKFGFLWMRGKMVIYWLCGGKDYIDVGLSFFSLFAGLVKYASEVCTYFVVSNTKRALHLFCYLSSQNLKKKLLLLYTNISNSLPSTYIEEAINFFILFHWYDSNLKHMISRYKCYGPIFPCAVQ